MKNESEYKAIRDYMKNDSVDKEQQSPQRVYRKTERVSERERNKLFKNSMCINGKYSNLFFVSQSTKKNFSFLSQNAI